MNKDFNIKIARYLAIFTFILSVVVACKKPENNIGSDFLDEQTFEGGIFTKSKLSLFTIQTDPYITSRPPYQLLGSFKDPNFGKINAGFAFQTALSRVNPDFGTNPQVDSVVLSIPYISGSIVDTIKTVGDNNEEIKTLVTYLVFDTDSIYGNRNLPMHIKVSELTKLLNPDSSYVSNVELPSSTVLYENTSFRPKFVNKLINGVSIATIDSLTIHNHDRDGKVLDTIKIPPAFRINLDKDFFQQKFIDLQGSAELVNNANFINYFKGLKIESLSDDGAIYSFNVLSGTNLTVYYKNDDVDDEGELLPPQTYTFAINTSYAIVNKIDYDRTFINNWGASNPLYKQIVDFDTVDGSSEIYLSNITGLQGKLKLFTDQAQLDSLRNERLLINEANIVFRVSSNNGKSFNAPQRLFLYNSDSIAKSGNYYSLIDELYEQSLFGGYLGGDVTAFSGDNRYYKFRITNHVAQILNGFTHQSSTGADSIAYGENFPIRVKLSNTITSPQRVVLSANDASSLNIGDKDIYLEIHYTKDKIN